MSAVVVEFFNQSPVFIALVILCILVGLLVMVVLPVFLGSWLADRDELTSEPTDARAAPRDRLDARRRTSRPGGTR